MAQIDIPMKRITFPLLFLAIFTGLFVFSNYRSKHKIEEQNNKAWTLRLATAKTRIDMLQANPAVLVELTNALVNSHERIRSNSFSRSFPEVPPPPDEKDYNILLYTLTRKNAQKSGRNEISNVCDILLTGYPDIKTNPDIEQMLRDLTNEIPSK
jgi:hypothetical protein